VPTFRDHAPKQRRTISGKSGKRKPVAWLPMPENVIAGPAAILPARAYISLAIPLPRRAVK
jgi:hypothetical protein